jgi:hypothetical protein
MYHPPMADNAASPSTSNVARRGAGIWIRRAGVALAAVVVAVIGAAYFLPREPEVTRRIEIAAPADKLFPLVADLRHFPEWSPWFVADPATAITFTGPLDGAGQTLSWKSASPQVGWGKMTVATTDPSRSAEILVDFADQGTATSWFRLEPAEEGKTTVTWGIRTDLGFSPLNRYSGLWIDGVVGPDFERGLARLKALAEAPPKTG